MEKMKWKTDEWKKIYGQPNHENEFHRCRNDDKMMTSIAKVTINPLHACMHYMWNMNQILIYIAIAPLFQFHIRAGITVMRTHTSFLLLTYPSWTHHNYSIVILRRWICYSEKFYSMQANFSFFMLNLMEERFDGRKNGSGLKCTFIMSFISVFSSNTLIAIVIMMRNFVKIGERACYIQWIEENI